MQFFLLNGKLTANFEEQYKKSHASTIKRNYVLAKQQETNICEVFPAGLLLQFSHRLPTPVLVAVVL